SRAWPARRPRPCRRRSTRSSRCPTGSRASPSAEGSRGTTTRKPPTWAPRRRASTRSPARSSSWPAASTSEAATTRSPRAPRARSAWRSSSARPPTGSAPPSPPSPSRSSGCARSSRRSPARRRSQAPATRRCPPPPVPASACSRLTRRAARRWLQLGPPSVQPSEQAKFARVLYVARSLVKKGERLATLEFGILPHYLVVGLVAGLVLLEPDFGTAALAMGLLVFMLFVGGVPARLMAFPALTALPALAAVAWKAPYRWARIVAFLYPDRDPLGVNFQLQQSFIAFGSGGLWGVGLGASQQKMFYLPEAHTDFLFSVIGEELGLTGALVVLALFAVVAARGFRVAVRHQDRFASLLAFGVTLSLVLQGVVNAG